MIMKVGMRELARNSNILDGYDYVEVEDEKTHEYKGLDGKELMIEVSKAKCGL